MRTPRDYQTDLIRRAAISLKQNKWVIVQSPTGSGKSFVMLLIAESGMKKGKTFLVLTESQKIFSQLSTEFGAFRINAKTNYFTLWPGNVYVAMSQSLANRPKIIQSFLDLGDDLILMIDEAHVGTTKKVIELFPGPRLGFTATPAYKWAKFLPELYNDLVPGLQVEELISKKALCPYRHIGRKKIESSDLVLSSTGDFTEASQEKAFSSTKVFEGLYEDLNTVNFRCGIIYVASIKQCEQVYNNLNNIGYNCAINHSKLSQERQKEEMYKFEHSPDCFLMVSVGSLTKGYDNPIIDLVVLLRATTSLPLYLQMVGRGGRPLTKQDDINRFNSKDHCHQIKTKDFFTCLDYGLNFYRFDAWDADRDWEELWKAQPKRAAEAAPVKECPECQSYLATSARICKWCGYEYPEQEAKFEQGELVYFTPGASRFAGKYISELLPHELAEWAKEKNKKNRAIRVAMARRQRERWEKSESNFLKEFGEAMGYKPNWYQVKTGEIIEHEKNAALAADSAASFDVTKHALLYHDHKIR